ncbi:serine hydrolase domain-containing protein [Ensifer soli]|uniref:serine hydrolase domain-containing protein n=1 Tax=Ciceribacter sp. sgz301302 TaxID=3342379 RepID=UPI0035BA1C5F
MMKWVAGSVLVLLAGVLGWLAVAPPALLRVGSGYAAKIVCSNVFLAGRAPDEVLATDVQAPGHPLLRLMRVTVDRDAGRVHAALLGFIAGSDAVHRPGLGCAVVPDGRIAEAASIRLPDAAAPALPVKRAAWPEGDIVSADPAFAALVADPALTGPGMRAVVVVHKGRIAAEAYGPGFTEAVPLLGWSMAKTINAVLVGRLVNDGRLSLKSRALLPEWQGDRRSLIRLSDLLAMRSGLAFNESYGGVADVTRMLYLEPDMARFAALSPLEISPGMRFGYSSGTSMLIARIWMNRFADPIAALAYPRDALFSPLGMASAVMEADAAGTLVGSSYVYATARDWARFALFLLRDGVWETRLLPEGFVRGMGEAGVAGAPYSRLQTWLSTPKDGPAMPAGSFFLRGHDGQSIAIVPALDLAVIRLGLTPRAQGYEATGLVEAAIRAAR